MVLQKYEAWGLGQPGDLIIKLYGWVVMILPSVLISSSGPCALVSSVSFLLASYFVLRNQQKLKINLSEHYKQDLICSSQFLARMFIYSGQSEDSARGFPHHNRSALGKELQSTAQYVLRCSRVTPCSNPLPSDFMSEDELLALLLLSKVSVVSTQRPLLCNLPHINAYRWHGDQWLRKSLFVTGLLRRSSNMRCLHVSIELDQWQEPQFL